jgi:hypothetical protein
MAGRIPGVSGPLVLAGRSLETPGLGYRGLAQKNTALTSIPRTSTQLSLSDVI